MGWSFNCVDNGKKPFIDSLTRPDRFTAGYTPLKHRLVGNNLWQLVRINATGEVYIKLDLIAKERGAGWGYKGLDEHMGPAQVNCPLSYLDQASPTPSGYAIEWREKVRQYHRRTRAIAGFAARSAGLSLQLSRHLNKVTEK